MKHLMVNGIGTVMNIKQARGSIHCHGMAKLKDDPGLCKLGETALKRFLTEKVAENSKSYDVLCEIEQGKEASQKSCCLYRLLNFYFQSTFTSAWTKPETHPSRRKHEQIEDRESDYIDLLNTVQRHSQCSTKYCLKKIRRKAI